MDTQGLFRALLNLGLNSIDAMPGGGMLEFRAFRKALRDLIPPHTVDSTPFRGSAPNTLHRVIQVHDTGTGISEDDLRRIFDPFFSTKGSKGTGLGLSSTRKFVDDHGGWIHVESQPEKGTSFYLIFE